MTNPLDKYLVSDWRDSWRWFSVQAVPVATGAMMAVAAYPDLLVMLASMLGGSERLQAVILVGALSIVAVRLWNQEADDEQD